MTRPIGIVLLTMAAALLVLPAAGAYPESAASQLHADIEAAWHEPEIVEPGTQWHGFLRLREGQGNAVANASYQICNLRDGVCFAPPTAADRLDERTFGFDTNDYLAGGRPVVYEAGWRIGVKWFFTHQNGTESCLPGPCLPSDPQAAALEDHYLVFDMPPEQKVGIPASSTVVSALAVLSLVALLRRAGREI